MSEVESQLDVMRASADAREAYVRPRGSYEHESVSPGVSQRNFLIVADLQFS